MAAQSADQNSKKNLKNEIERLRREEQSSLVNKLLSLMIVEKMSLHNNHTVNAILRLVMSYIVRKILIDKMALVNSTSPSLVSRSNDIELPVKRLDLIVWEEDDIDIVDYDIDQDNDKMMYYGCKLSDYIIIDQEFKINLKNTLEGLDPWEIRNLGPFECKIKGEITNCNQRQVILHGTVVRGEIMDNRNKRKAGNDMQVANIKRLKIQPLALNKNSQSTSSYLAGFSLRNGWFTRFSENFTAITGIQQQYAIGKSPNDFIHPDDKYFNNIALRLWSSGMWDKPCSSRLKKGNSNSYIVITCQLPEFSPSLFDADNINIATYVISDTNQGLARIEEDRKEITTLVLEIIEKHQNFLRAYDELLEMESSTCQPILLNSNTPIDFYGNMF